MLVRHSKRPGLTIGINGLVGNLGVALAAVVTGFLVKYAGWRWAFVVPGIITIALGFVFARVAPHEGEPPAKRKSAAVALPSGALARFLLVITITSSSATLLFNFATNGNGEFLRERMDGIISDPATLGMLLAVVYVIASFAQVIVGALIDRVPLKVLYGAIVLLQIPMLVAASMAHGWWLYALMIAFMILIFGAIPFTDATIVRFVDDRIRSRVAGMRLTVAFGASSLAVWALGPLVKTAGFSTLLLVMAAISLVTFLAILALPDQRKLAAHAVPAAARGATEAHRARGGRAGSRPRITAHRRRPSLRWQPPRGDWTSAACRRAG